MVINIHENKGAVIFEVRVIPRSSKSEIVGEHDGALKVKLRSPPVGGAANDELVKLLAKITGVSKSRIEIVSGKSGRTKQIRITGIKSENLSEALFK